MPDDMRIAILLSTYNGERYLKTQMESLMNQTMVQYMHLYVRDDGSSDKTIQIIKEYFDKIPVTIFQGENLGPAQSFWILFMNQSIQADYYAFCDQDDIWDCDKLEKGIKAIQEHEDPQLWCSNCRVIDAEGNLISELYHKEDPLFSLSAQFVCGSIQGCAMIWNDQFRQFILQKNIKNFPMHDFVLITHAINMDCLVYDKTPSFSYRIHGKNYFAKEDKKSISSIKASLHRWFSDEQRNTISDYAIEFIRNNLLMVSQKEKEFIELIACSRTNILKRIKLSKSEMITARDERAVRAFKIKALLGIL